jgi:hypothetical protein
MDDEALKKFEQLFGGYSEERAINLCITAFAEGYDEWQFIRFFQTKFGKEFADKVTNRMCKNIQANVKRAFQEKPFIMTHVYDPSREEGNE